MCLIIFNISKKSIYQDYRVPPNCSSNGQTKNERLDKKKLDERLDGGLNETSGEGKYVGRTIIYGLLFHQIICPILRSAKPFVPESAVCHQPSDPHDEGR